MAQWQSVHRHPVRWSGSCLPPDRRPTRSRWLPPVDSQENGTNTCRRHGCHADDHQERRAQQQRDDRGGDPGHPGVEHQVRAGGHRLHRGERGEQRDRQQGGDSLYERRLQPPCRHGQAGQLEQVAPGALTTIAAQVIEHRPRAAGAGRRRLAPARRPAPGRRPGPAGTAATATAAAATAVSPGRAPSQPRPQQGQERGGRGGVEPVVAGVPDRLPARPRSAS